MHSRLNTRWNDEPDDARERSIFAINNYTHLLYEYIAAQRVWISSGSLKAIFVCKAMMVYNIIANFVIGILLVSGDSLCGALLYG